MSKYWVRIIPESEDDVVYGHTPGDASIEAMNMPEAASEFVKEHKIALPARITVIDSQITTQGFYRVTPETSFNIRCERGISLRTENQ